jgi:hypothetical protein
VAFNITRLKVTNRDWARGEPPPCGSIEWAGVPDMFEPEPPRTAASGFQVFEIGFTELDAADRWVKRLEENVRYTRQIHGDKILSKTDAAEWDAFASRWAPFRQKLQHPLKSPAYVQMMLRENKQQLDALLHESRKLHNKFVAKGMPMVPIPYMGELVLLLRTLPKAMRAPEMRAKLEAGAKCGDKLLDSNTAWWQWRMRDDTRGLTRAIEDARAAANVFARARTATAWSPSSFPLDEFLRRLTKIYIEAAGLYGVAETKRTAVAEAADEVRKVGKEGTDWLTRLLVALGLGYLGLRWITQAKSPKIVIKVPDAVPKETP